MAVTLWSKNGKLISSDDTLQLIKCDRCPCDSIAIELSCPSSLHTLGEGKPFSITATYAAPSASSVLPHIEITYDCVPADTNVYIMLESGGVLDFTTGWTGTLGTDEVLTFDAGNIMAVGTIMESSGTDRTCNATITAWDPNKVDTNGDPIEPVTCTFPIYDDIICTGVTLDKDICAGETFTADLTLTGTGASRLTRLDDSNGGLTHYSTRFSLYLVGIDVPPEATVTWTNGKWEGTGLTNTDLTTIEISFEEYGVELCNSEMTVHECSISNITISGADALHTLGAAKELVITVTYTDITFMSDLPSVAILVPSLGSTSYTGTVLDDGTRIAVDFSTGWTTDAFAGTKTWSHDIYIDSVTTADTNRTIEVQILATSPHYTYSDDSEIQVTHGITLSDAVACGSVELVAMTNECVGAQLYGKITVTGADGEELTRLDSETSPGLFTGSPPRFAVVYGGPYEEIAEGLGWYGNGNYEGPLMEITDATGDITMTLNEFGEFLCDDNFTPQECNFTPNFETCPESLHTLGGSKTLTLTYTYTNPELYAPLVYPKFFKGETQITIDSVTLVMEDGVGGTDVATFDIDEWTMNGAVRTWSHQIQLSGMPSGWADGDVLSIKIMADYVDTAGNDIVAAQCDIALHNLVECDGTTIMQSACCVHEEVPVTITVTGTNDDELVRMDSTENAGLFTPGGRFTVTVTGGGTSILPPDFSIPGAWVAGVWTATLTPTSYQDNPVTVSFADTAAAANPVCEGELLVKECGCTVEIDCPLNLHVYGDAKTLTITITYTDPDLNDTHPNFYIEMAAVGDPLEEIYDEDGLLDLSDGPGSLNWTWYGNTKVWQKFIHINNVEHVDGKTDVIIRATHINSEGVEENLDTCKMTLSTLINCTISGLPSDGCVDADDGKKDVGFSISVTGDPSETLTDWDPSPGGRFSITTSLPLPDGVSLYSGWTNGKWSVSEIEAGPGEHSVTLYDGSYPNDGCKEEFALHDCTMTATISGCPVTIHSLGDGAEITITVYYSSYDFYHPDATVSITGNAATWNGGSWEAIGGGKKTMTGTVTGVLNAAGTATLTVKDPDGNTLAECIITVVNGVECSITFDPEETCITTPVDENQTPVTVTIEVEGVNGEELTRFYEGIDRFSVDYDGLDPSPIGSWSGATYTATMPSVESVIVSLSDAVNQLTVCYSTYTGLACAVEIAFISCPQSLHTLGQSKSLEIEATYTHPTVYSDAPDIYIFGDAEGGDVCPDCLNYGSLTWSELSNNKRTLSTSISVDTIPHGFTNGTVRIDVVDPRTAELLNSCAISVTDEITCSITYTSEGVQNPDSICDYTAFDVDISVELSGTDNDPDRMETGTRFFIEMSDNVTPPDGCSLTGIWSNGHWNCTGFEATEGSCVVSLMDGNDIACTESLTIDPCRLQVSFENCPSVLNVLGEGKTLTITATSREGEIPIIQILEEDGSPAGSGALCYDSDDSPLDFSPSAWVLVTTGTYQWSGVIRVNGISAASADPDECRYEIRSRHPSLTDENDDPLILNSCWITASDVVSCSMEGVDFSVCTYIPFLFSIQLTADNGDSLVRIDSSEYPGLFGTGNRFSVVMEGAIGLPEECSFVSGWVAGYWNCLITANEVGTVSISLLERAGTSRERPLCSVEPEIIDCEVQAVIIGPDTLHIYGEAASVSIDIQYQNPDYTPIPIVAFTVKETAGEVLYTGSVYDATTLMPVSFSTAMWTADSSGALHWERTIYVSSIAGGVREQQIYLTVYHPTAQDATGARLMLTQHPIKLSSLFSGTLTLSSSKVCVGDTFDVNVHLTSEDGDALPRLLNKTVRSFVKMCPPLQEYEDADDVNFAANSVSFPYSTTFDADGKASTTCTARVYDITDSPDTVVMVDVTDTTEVYNIDTQTPGVIVLDEASLHIIDCRYTATITAPAKLHTLGAGEVLRIALQFGHVDATSTDVVVETRVTSRIGVICSDCLVDVNGAPLDFSTGWQVEGLLKSWTKEVYADKIPGGGTNGVLTVVVWGTSNSPDYSYVTRNITMESRIRCDIAGPTAACLDESFAMLINAKGYGGELLTRMTSATHPEHFGTGNRFEVSLQGAYAVADGFVVDTAWTNGLWLCPLIGIPTTPTTSDYSFILQLIDNVPIEDTVVCEQEVTAIDCEWFEAILTVPAGYLTVSFTFTGTKMLVLWGDETAGELAEEITSGTCSHTYASAGTYLLQCKGTAVSKCTFGNTSDSYNNMARAITSTNENWAALSGSGSGLTNGDNMFRYCKALTVPFNTLPSNLTTAVNMFRYSTADFAGIVLPENITDATRMFSYCSSAVFENLMRLPNALETATEMFYSCTNATFASLYTLSDSLVYCNSMFNTCSKATFIRLQSLGNADISTAVNAFLNNTEALFSSLTSICTSLITASSMFSGCQKANFNKVTSLPTGLVGVEKMFYNCYAADFIFTEFPSTITSAVSMFQNCRAAVFNLLQSLPAFLVTGTDMFNGCTNAVFPVMGELPDTLVTGTNMFRVNSKAIFAFENFPDSLVSCASMFYLCTNALLNPLEITVTTATNMFDGCSSSPFAKLTSVTLRTGGGANYMFRDCTAGTFELLASLTFPTTGANVYAKEMFKMCTGGTFSSLTTLPLGVVYQASEMFYNCENAILPLTSITGSKLYWGDKMFYSCKKALLSPSSLPVTLVYMEAMFYGCAKAPLDLDATALSDLINVSLETGFISTFAGCTEAILNITGMPPVRYADEAFRYCKNALLPLSSVSPVLRRGLATFEGCEKATFSSLTSLPSSLRNGVRMFRNCHAAVLPLSGTLGQIVAGTRMFENCYVAQLPITGLYAVHAGSYMFKNCYVASLPIATWGFIYPIPAYYSFSSDDTDFSFTSMFENCYNAGLTFSDIHTGAEESPSASLYYTHMEADSMFKNCRKALLPLTEFAADSCISTFEGCDTASLPLVKLHVRGNTRRMFRNCKAATLPLTGGLTATPGRNIDAAEMFFECRNGTLDIPPGALFTCTDISYMFYNCGKAKLNFTDWTPTLLTRSEYAFYNCKEALLSLSGAFTNSIIRNAEYMFYKCGKASLGFTALPVNLNKATSMFDSCTQSTLPLTSLPASLTDGSFVFYNSGATFNVNEVAWPFTTAYGFTIWGCSDVVGNARELYCYCESNDKGYPGQNCMSTTSCEEWDESIWPTDPCETTGSSEVTATTGTPGDDGCRPGTISSFTTNSDNPVMDLSTLGNSGGGGAVWRLVERRYSLTYHSGSISAGGTLNGLPTSFSSRYSYDGHMELQRGCIRNGVVVWS